MLKQNTLISYTLFLLFIFSFSTLSAQLTVSPTSSVTDGTDYPALDGAWDITTVVIGEKTYALVVAYDDDGVQIMELVDPSLSTEEILEQSVLLYPQPRQIGVAVEIRISNPCSVYNLFPYGSGHGNRSAQPFCA